MAKIFNSGGIPESPSRKRLKGFAGRLEMSCKCSTAVWSVKSGLFLISCASLGNH